jgi:hypothetical protein
MTSKIFAVLALAGMIGLGGAGRAAVPQGSAQDTTHCHPSRHGSPPSGHDAMTHRGDQGMGFLQTKTTHHFRLQPEGGVIAISANDPKDATTRDQIRLHLEHVAQAFSRGDFDIPMFVHDQVPPGVPKMKRLAGAIHSRFTETEDGGKVSISSGSPGAVTAIHAFLAFQIREHGTGDPLTIRQ